MRRNQVDSDRFVSMLAEVGYVSVGSPEAADLVMVNTCAFLEDACRESVETILSVPTARKPGARTILVGCMAPRFGAEVEAALPEVGAVSGLDHYSHLVPTLDQLTGRQPLEIPGPGELIGAGLTSGFGADMEARRV